MAFVSSTLLRERYNPRPPMSAFPFRTFPEPHTQSRHNSFTVFSPSPPYKYMCFWMSICVGGIAFLQLSSPSQPRSQYAFCFTVELGDNVARLFHGSLGLRIWILNYPQTLTVGIELSSELFELALKHGAKDLQGNRDES